MNRPESEWIEHTGDECPIPWAKNGEYQAKRADGGIYGNTIDAARIDSWQKMLIAKNTQIVTYRLTDGWIPIPNLQWPDQFLRTWVDKLEFKLASGIIVVSTSMCRFENYHNEFSEFIIAIRLRSLMEESAARAMNLLGTLKLGRIEEHHANIFNDLMSSYEAKRKAIRMARTHRENVPPIGQNEMMLIAGKAMEDK